MPKAPTVPAPRISAKPSPAPRYFELVDDKSQKFWEISVDRLEVTVRYGRIGANGTTKVKTLENSEKAASHAAKLIGEKMKKGSNEK